MNVHHFSLNMGVAVVDLLLFRCFSDVAISSGDIRDQTLKSSKTAPNFGRFLPCQILGVVHAFGTRGVLPEAEFQPPKLSPQSDVRRRAAAR